MKNIHNILATLLVVILVMPMAFAENDRDNDRRGDNRDEGVEKREWKRAVPIKRAIQKINSKSQIAVPQRTPPTRRYDNAYGNIQQKLDNVRNNNLIRKKRELQQRVSDAKENLKERVIRKIERDDEGKTNALRKKLGEKLREHRGNERNEEDREEMRKNVLKDRIIKRIKNDDDGKTNALRKKLGEKLERHRENEKREKREPREIKKEFRGNFDKIEEFRQRGIIDEFRQQVREQKGELRGVESDLREQVANGELGESEAREAFRAKRKEIKEESGIFGFLKRLGGENKELKRDEKGERKERGKDKMRELEGKLREKVKAGELGKNEAREIFREKRREIKKDDGIFGFLKRFGEEAPRVSEKLNKRTTELEKVVREKLVAEGKTEAEIAVEVEAGRKILKKQIRSKIRQNRENLKMKARVMRAAETVKREEIRQLRKNGNEEIAKQKRAELRKVLVEEMKSRIAERTENAPKNRSFWNRLFRRDAQSVRDGEIQNLKDDLEAEGADTAEIEDAVIDVTETTADFIIEVETE